MKKLLVYAVANDVIKTYVSIFLNLYLWSEGQSLINIALFNVAMYFSWFFVFPIGANLIHKKGVKFIYRTSSIFNVLLFLIILIVPKENLYIWILIVGMVNGVSRSIYSSGKNIAVSLMAEGNEIARYYQYEVLYMRVAQIVTPLVFGVIIFYTSYTISFLIMVFYSVFLYFLAESIEDIESENKKENVLRGLFKTMKNADKKIKMLPYSYILGGTFPEFQVLFLAVFTFTITENQIGVAVLNVIYSLVIMVLIKVTNRFNSVNGYKLLYIGATLGFVGMGLMYFEKEIMLILANVFIVSGTFFYSTTYYAQQLEVMKGLPKEERMQLIVVREQMLILARMMVLTVTIILGVVVDLEGQLQMTLIGFFVMVMTLFVPNIHKKMMKK